MCYVSNLLLSVDIHDDKEEGLDKNENGMYNFQVYVCTCVCIVCVCIMCECVYMCACV